MQKRPEFLTLSQPHAIALCVAAYAALWWALPLRSTEAHACLPQLGAGERVLVMMLSICSLLLFFAFANTAAYKSHVLRTAQPTPLRATAGSTARISLVLPVKGVHAQSRRNWRAQLSHAYPGVRETLFVVQERADPAHAALVNLLAEPGLPHSARARVLVAGRSRSTSQKLHNILHALGNVDEKSEYLLLLDDDFLPGAQLIQTMVDALQANHEAFGAGGTPFDIPGDASLLCHVRCTFRLLFNLNQPPAVPPSAVGHVVWGGCCLLRLSQIGMLRQYWQDGAYSDDWLLMQMCKRQKWGFINPPTALCPSVVRTPSLREWFNFQCRQFFVLDTYLALDSHVAEWYFLAHFYFFLSPAFGLGTPVMCYRLLAWVAQLGVATSVGDGCAEELPAGASHDAGLLVLALALHGLFVRALYNIVRVNTAIVDAFGGGRGGGGRGGSRNGCGDDVEDEGAEHELPPHAEGFKLWFGWILFMFVAPVCVLCGLWRSSIMWAGIRYTKAGGKVVKVEHGVGDDRSWFNVQ